MKVFYRSRRRGAAAVEYGAMLALLMAVALFAVQMLGQRLKASYENIHSQLPTVTSSTDGNSTSSAGAGSSSNNSNPGTNQSGSDNSNDPMPGNGSTKKKQ